MLPNYTVTLHDIHNPQVTCPGKRESDVLVRSKAPCRSFVGVIQLFVATSGSEVPMAWTRKPLGATGYLPGVNGRWTTSNKVDPSIAKKAITFPLGR